MFFFQCEDFLLSMWGKFRIFFMSENIFTLVFSGNSSLPHVKLLILPPHLSLSLLCTPALYLFELHSDWSPHISNLIIFSSVLLCCFTLILRLQNLMMILFITRIYMCSFLKFSHYFSNIFLFSHFFLFVLSIQKMLIKTSFRLHSCPYCCVFAHCLSWEFVAFVLLSSSSERLAFHGRHLFGEGQQCACGTVFLLISHPHVMKVAGIQNPLLDRMASGFLLFTNDFPLFCAHP